MSELLSSRIATVYPLQVIGQADRGDAIEADNAEATIIESAHEKGGAYFPAHKPL